MGKVQVGVCKNRKKPRNCEPKHESGWFGSRNETDENWFSMVLLRCESMTSIWFMVQPKTRPNRTVHTPRSKYLKLLGYFISFHPLH